MAEWIWYPGEYELFHSILLNNRRQELGADYPCFWLLPSIYPNVQFNRTFECPEDGEFVFRANGAGYILLDGKRYAEGKRIKYTAGKHALHILVGNPRGLPAAYVEGDGIYTDGSWTASRPNVGDNVPCGHMAVYSSPDDDVEVFPFEYKKQEPVCSETVEGGVLYDFGRETFGRIVLGGVSGTVDVIYGESREEALDPEYALVRQLGISSDGELISRAFRYIFVRGNEQPRSVYMLYEYLPLEYKASFEADDPTVKQVFDTCAYTFHLNSREFFLDGIKRDRWVWSGDAYQSYMVNRYLFDDDELTKRTITALVGKPPYVQHINTINDYSFYQMIGVWEYLHTSGDAEFVRAVYPRLKELFRFCVSRLDENGFVCGRKGDWIFIDWADLDKEGPMCAEQILLWRATCCMLELAELCSDTIDFAPQPDVLREKIFCCYWCEEKGGFIDGYVSGKRVLNRQQNVLAILYGLVEGEQAESIYEKVLANASVPAITTPYFEFFELLAMCKLGHVELAQKMIVSYWGGMLKLGATSIWEQFDPNEKGAEHYAMYGNKYGRSLCHAWGSGPVYILGRYIAGVEQNGMDGSFTVSPLNGLYKSFKATVPLRGGNEVRVSYQNGSYTVCATADGGCFKKGDEHIPLEKNREYVF